MQTMQKKRPKRPKSQPSCSIMEKLFVLVTVYLCTTDFLERDLEERIVEVPNYHDNWIIQSATRTRLGSAHSRSGCDKPLGLGEASGVDATNQLQSLSWSSLNSPSYTSTGDYNSNEYHLQQRSYSNSDEVVSQLVPPLINDKLECAVCGNYRVGDEDDDDDGVGDEDNRGINDFHERLLEARKRGGILIGSRGQVCEGYSLNKFGGLCSLTTRHKTRTKTISGRRWSVVKLAHAIRLIRLDVPATIRAGQNVKMKCIYDAKGDKLQSLSWYKNGREFYRYQPFERRQPVLVFNTTGVQLDMNRSRNNSITIINTTFDTSGRYKCEATGTSFQEAHLESFLEVLPAIASGVEAMFSLIVPLCCSILSSVCILKV